jgi:16S rRNA (guanine527-N7)-methyltransferase
MTREELKAARIEISRPEHARLAEFVRLLLAENQHINLTGTREPAEYWARHVCDCLQLLPLLRADPPKKLVDLGTGGGLPGLPLACVLTDVQFTLIDATRKKLAVLERISMALQLANVHYVWGRAEVLAHESRLRERFDVLTARAVAKLPLLIEYAAGFVRPFGRLLLMKSVQAVEQELPGAEGAEAACRVRRAAVHRYPLPAPHGERVVIEYVRTGALERRLPRAPGVAERQPL